MHHNLADFHISSGVSFEGRFVKQIGTWLLHKAATPSTRPRPHTVPIVPYPIMVPIVLLSSGFATSPCCCTFFPISI